MPLKVIPRRDRKLNRVIKGGEHLSLRRGEFLFRVGEEAGDLFLVRKGHLQLTTPEEKGRTMGIVGPWELTGEAGLRRGATRQISARAGEATEVTVLDGAGARRALRTSEGTFEAYLAAKDAEVTLGRALTGLGKPGGTSKRVALVLLGLAERFGGKGEGGMPIPLRLTHQLLADLSASHRSTVTTILNDWIYQEILGEEAGRILILDPGRLR